MKKSSKPIVVAILAALFVQMFASHVTYAGKYYPDLTATSNVLNVGGFYPSIVIDDFNVPDKVDTVDKWSKGAGVSKVYKVIDPTKILNSPGQAYEGSGVIEAESAEVKVYEWRTISKEYQTPLDLSGTKYLTFAANCYGWKSEDYLLKINLYSGTDKYEGIAKITPNNWNELALNIEDWAGRQAITKIEFSFTLNYDLEGMSEGEPGYEWWGGAFQIDYLSASNALDMDFNVEGDSEGFTAQGGTLTTAKGELMLSVSSPDPILQSPEIIKDLSLYNSLAVSMRNTSAFSKVRVDWITETDQTWDASKSETFDIESGDSKNTNDYEFNFSANPQWTGSLKQFRFHFTGEGSPTSGNIAIDKIQFKQLAPIISYSGKLAVHEIVNGNQVQLQGNIKPEVVEQFKNDTIELFELAAYEDENDLSTKVALITDTAVTDDFSFSIDLMDLERSRLYSKFVAAIKHLDGSYTLLDRAKYITNPEVVAKNDYPFPTTESKKGLQVQMVGDAEDLGISHAALNISYNEALYLDGNVDPDNTLVYEYEGKNYYFNKNWIQTNDNDIKSLSDNNVTISLILLMYRDLNPETPNAHLIHPDAGTSGIVYAFNTTNKLGLEYYKVITHFLAERYTREDEKYGRAVNYIVGNEVDDSEAWYNMGRKRIDEFVEDYARTVRITDAIVKSNYKNGRVYISLTHDWDHGLPPNSEMRFDGRAIVDRLNAEIQEHGNISWNIAYHPYPENIFDPKVWNAPNSSDRFDTDKITFKNLNVLVDYMKQPKYLYQGEPRRIILSEQGFHSGDNSLENQKIQAAAYAYAYYRVDFLNGIDSFILHRHVDHAGESGLNLGLWTHTADTSLAQNLPYEHKYVYDVFKYIDTARSLEVSDFAKEIIGIQDWDEIAPGFDASKLNRRTIPELAPAEAINPVKLTGVNVLSDFEKGTDGWESAEYVSNVEVDSDEKLVGNQSLKAAVMWSLRSEKEYKGISKVFDTPIDFTEKPYLFFGIKPVGTQGIATFTIRAKIYSGNDVIEGTAVIKPDEWSNIAFNLSNWAKKDKVSRIKIWIKPTLQNSWSNGYFNVDNIGQAGSTDPTEPPCYTCGTPGQSGSSNPDTREISEQELKNVRDGKVVFVLENGQTGISLPRKAADILNRKLLEVTSGHAKVSIPAKLLEELNALEAAGDARIILHFAPTNEVPSQVAVGASSVKLKAGGQMYAFSISLRTGDVPNVKDFPLTEFKHPVKLELPYDPGKADEELLSIYNYNMEAGVWAYAGRTIDRANKNAVTAISHPGIYAVLAYDKTFSDVPADHWVYRTLKVLSAIQVVRGVTDDAFNPNGKTTRAEFSALLVRSLGLKGSGKAMPFTDLDAKAWYAGELAVAYETGLIQGVSKDRFDPNAPITREEMAALLVRAYEYSRGESFHVEDVLQTFKDGKNVSTWARNDVNKAIAKGLLQGKGKDIFDPNAVATRAETAQAILNLLRQE